MSPKLHRRTPSSAHTYRLLIFKELANLLACAVLSKRCVHSSKEAELCGTFRTSSSIASTGSFIPLRLLGCFARQTQSQLLWRPSCFPSSALLGAFPDSLHNSADYPTRAIISDRFVNTLIAREA
jgi:hypothetical protein